MGARIVLWCRLVQQRKKTWKNTMITYECASSGLYEQGRINHSVSALIQLLLASDWWPFTDAMRVTQSINQSTLCWRRLDYPRPKSPFHGLSSTNYSVTAVSRRPSLCMGTCITYVRTTFRGRGLRKVIVLSVTKFGMRDVRGTLVWNWFGIRNVKQLVQSCPWVGLTRGLGWVGSGMGRKFVFSGFGWVMGLKWQKC